jgi:molybdenum cofactor cytidylyltransferase
MGGQHKLLLPLGDRPVLARVLDAALASRARPIVLVLGYHAERVRASIPTYSELHDITSVDNPDYRLGMSTSMKLGIRTLPSLHDYKKVDGREVDSALFLVGDQPLITADVIDRVIETYEAGKGAGKRIVVPLYAGQRGNPVLFDAGLFAELLEVTGDEGGRGLLRRHAGEVATVEIGDAAASSDVDTWEAYQQILRTWEQRQAGY